MYLLKREKVSVPSDMSLIGMDQDPYYRYKMEALRISYDKKDTVLTNVFEIAKDLGIRHEYVLEYFLMKLKAKSEVREYKKRTEVRLIGFYEQSILQRAIDDFIVEYLVCKRCRLPEVRYRSEINRLIGDCGACGFMEIFDPREDKMKEVICNKPPLRDKEEIDEQEWDDMVYGNREAEYESESQSEIESEGDGSCEQESEEDKGASAVVDGNGQK